MLAYPNEGPWKYEVSYFELCVESLAIFFFFLDFISCVLSVLGRWWFSGGTNRFYQWGDTWKPGRDIWGGGSFDTLLAICENWQPKRFWRWTEWLQWTSPFCLITFFTYVTNHIHSMPKAEQKRIHLHLCAIETNSLHGSMSSINGPFSATQGLHLDIYNMKDHRHVLSSLKGSPSPKKGKC